MMFDIVKTIIKEVFINYELGTVDSCEHIRMRITLFDIKI